MSPFGDFQSVADLIERLQGTGAHLLDPGEPGPRPACQPIPYVDPDAQQGQPDDGPCALRRSNIPVIRVLGEAPKDLAKSALHENAMR